MFLMSGIQNTLLHLPIGENLYAWAQSTVTFKWHFCTELCPKQFRVLKRVCSYSIHLEQPT